MTTLLDAILAEAEVLLEPIADAADDERARRELFAGVGVDLTDAQVSGLESRFNSLESAYEDVSDLASSSGGGDLETLLGALEVVGNVFDGLAGIEDDLPDVDATDLVGDLVEYLFLEYLFSERPMVLNVLVLLTVVDVPGPDEGGGWNQLSLPDGTSLAMDRLGDLTTDPAGTLVDAYAPSKVTDPDEAVRIGQLLLPELTKLASLLGFDTFYSRERLTHADYGGVSGLTIASDTLSIYREFDGVGMVGARFALASSDDGLCLLLIPFGSTSVETTVGDWGARFALGAGFDVVVLNPDGIVHASPQSGELQGELGLEKTGGAGDDAAILGPSQGTRLELGALGLSSDWTLSSETTEVGIEANAGDSSFVVDAGNADSFIQHVLPEDGVSVDFDAGIGYHTERGLYFTGGAGLDTEIPVNLDIADVLKVETLRLAAKVDADSQPVTIPVHVAADPQVSLGPIDGVVEGIGLEAEIAFPEGQDGNLGPLDVDLGFKPPDGAGLSVDASAVTGGGYLEFDHENERYAGVLQLQVGEFTLTAVGLLTTRLPGGRDGFSLLLIISGEFPPVQLGFGFTLNAVGGLLGVNRTMDVDYLVAGVSDGTVRSIMFPEDPVRNAPQIISDLRNGFPVAAGNHVFGPMGRLGWGTPTMLSASVGVLLELPDPIRVVILGRVHAGLPHEEVGIVVFNMDVVGAVDFGEQIAGAAATLYDSRVLAYTLTGDMAMKTGWGEDPLFVLSVGGFNPRFDPPPDFPELRRIALTLGPGNPRVRWEGYFAVTSNTVQVGARVELYAAAAGFSFDGEMGFDTLFRFEPFELIADFYAGFALRRDGKRLMSVDVDGTLKGPGPWHVTGKASFEIWPLEFSVSFDEEFGPSESADELSPADVYGEVVAALGDERNWSAQRPEGGDSVVTLRQVQSEGSQVLAHPLGRLAVRQQVSPLGTPIEKYGNGEPASYDRFEVTSVSVGGTEADHEAAREKFARGEYFELSDSEKLEGPAFESYEAGRQVANSRFAWGGSDDDSLPATDALEYETAVIDERAGFQPIYLEPIAMPRSTASAVSAVSAVARGDLRTTGNERFEVTDDETNPRGIDAGISLGEAGYVVVRTDELTRVGLDDVPPGGTTKREAEEALSAHLAETGDDPDDYRVVGAHVVADGEGDA